MNFLNPTFLFGLAAAALPVLIHLFTRRRPKEVRFPSLEFLSEVNQSEIRRLKLKQWLLLLLRTLAVMAIALAMARPALEGGLAGKQGAASSIVVLVDVSGSMGATAADGKPLGATARRVTEDLIATLGAGDDMRLIPYDDTPRPVADTPLADASRLRGAAQALAAGARTTDHMAALELAARALRESRALNRELFWISDFQANGFAKPGAAPSAFRAGEGPWRDARVYVVPLAARSRANAAITDALLTPSPEGAALTVTATSHGAPAGDLAVEARDIGGANGAVSLGRGFVSLDTQGDASTLLPLSRVPEAGGEVLLPDDALALDNRRVFAAGRAGTLRVVLREDGGPSPLRLALEAGSPASGLDVRAVDGAALAAATRDADVVVIGDVERLGSGELQSVLDYWRGGGALLLAPGARADAAFWNTALLGELGAGTLGAIEAAPAGAAWRLQREAAGHAALAGFPARPGEPLSSARFGALRAFRAGATARVLLGYDRSRPALIEAPHALVLNALLEPASSDFAVSGVFLPLVHQMAKVLGRGTAAASLVPGDRFRLPGATGEWRIEDETGRDVPAALAAEGGATRLVSAPLERPGLYRVLESGRLRGSFAVNPDARESDLTTLDSRAILAGFPAGRARVIEPGADLARRVREARHGRELWPLFVMLALALLVAESVIGRLGMGDAMPGRAEAKA